MSTPDTRDDDVYTNLDNLGYLPQVRGFEADARFPDGVPFMYADTEGNISIGFGHNLTSAGPNALIGLLFTVRTTEDRAAFMGPGKTPRTGPDPKKLNQGADPIDINNDFNYLTEHLGGKKRSYNIREMQKYTTLIMGSTEINRLFKLDFIQHVQRAAREFGDEFYQYPPGAQAAIIDIDFNVRHGIGKGFPELTAAIKGKKGNQKDYSTLSESERWDIAAEQSHRGPPINEDRNDTVQNWFKEAAAAAKLKAAIIPAKTSTTTSTSTPAATK